MEIIKGKIFPDYFISCGMCNNSIPVGASDLKKAKAQAKEWKWKNTRKYGFVCPYCVKVKLNK